MCQDLLRMLSPLRTFEVYYSQVLCNFTKLLGGSKMIIHLKLTLPSVSIESSSRVIRNNITEKEVMDESNQIDVTQSMLCKKQR